jgi:hypothetical protein
MSVKCWDGFPVIFRKYGFFCALANLSAAQAVRTSPLIVSLSLPTHVQQRSYHWPNHSHLGARMANELEQIKPEDKTLRPWQEIAEELSNATDSQRIRDLGQELCRAMEREKGPRH